MSADVERIFIFDGKKIYSSVIPKEKCIETVAILRKN